MAMHQATVKNGVLEGVPGGNPAVTVFKGIPYAAPPVGELRWRPPQPAADWEGVRRAYTFRGICPQLILPEDHPLAADNPPPFEEISEDCLYLNVWTPAKSPEEKLPVLYWIHGGANVGGFGHMSAFDGEGFAKRGVILVTFTWRVNIFGWLVHPELSAESDRHISGNYAVMDQIAALTWVRENIAAFGGDPDCITVAGQSAGASSTQLLCTTPLTRGMIKRAIMQSGGGFALFSSHDFLTLQQAEATVDLKRALGVSTIEEARKLDSSEISSRIFSPKAAGAYLPMPVADGYVFPKTMAEMILEGDYHQIQYMIGCTCDETAMYIFPEDRELFLADQRTEYGDAAKDYLALCDFLNDDAAFRYHLKYRSAEMLQTGIDVWTTVIEKHGTTPPYVYSFNRRVPGDDLGAFHSCELFYQFETLDRTRRAYTGEDYELSKQMAAYWSNYIKTGSPNGPGLTEWTTYTTAAPAVMQLKPGPHMGWLEGNPRMEFRKNFILKNGGTTHE